MIFWVQCGNDHENEGEGTANVSDTDKATLDSSLFC